MGNNMIKITTQTKDGKEIKMVEPVTIGQPIDAGVYLVRHKELKIRLENELAKISAEIAEIENELSTTLK